MDRDLHLRPALRAQDVFARLERRYAVSRPFALLIYRGSPGDTAVVHLIPVVFNVETSKEIRPGLPRVAHENGYSFEHGGEVEDVSRSFLQAHGLQS